MMILMQEYLESLINDSFKLDQTLGILANKHYPEPMVKVFIEKELVPINSHLRDQLKRCLSESKCSLTISPKVKVVKAAWDFFCYIIRIVGTADIRSSQVEIIKIIDYWLKDLEENYILLITSANELNYSFQEIWLTFASFLHTNLDYENVTKYNVIHLCFPVSEKDNIFLSPIYAHEIGHFLDEKNGVKEKVISKNVGALPGSLKSMVTEQVAGSTKPVEEALAVSVIFDSFLTNWVAEVVADTFAICLAGPSFLFAVRAFEVCKIQDITSIGLIDQASESHPGNRLRLAFRWQVINDLSYLTCLPAGVITRAEEYVHSWSESVCTCRPVQRNFLGRMFLVQFTDENIRLCEDFILSLSDNIIKDVTSILGKAQFFAGDFREVVPVLTGRMAKLVPPNETAGGLSVSPNAIVNAAWVAKFEIREAIKSVVGRLSGNDEHLGNYEVEEIIKNLTRYAVMVSDVQRKWQDQ